MKYLIFVCTLFICHGTTIAQSLSEKNIQGVWEVEHVAINLEFENETQKERVNSVKEGFSGAQFFFSADHQFTIELNPEAPSTFDDEMFIDIYDWKLTHEKKHILIGNNVMEIIVTQKDGIYYFDFQVGLILRMKKIDDVAIISIADKIEKITNKNEN
ncbi:hypothetical protein A9Q87_13215 [Flavobacteriales bacterium 34_180_T64]|nr:hypothetical protein A9Q87_13215 [Flavobacteriales bacterium 34_180_T64]